ncbi:MAG: hypothetical protein O2887_10250 [Bacteroidetes bacterium]|nr:hypothetical protein [Bacteroidota bacterium]
MIVAVDFDGTLALGNKSHISILEPNLLLIERLQLLQKTINPKIKIITARGSKSNLTKKEKEKKYLKLISDWLYKYNVPFNSISFNKEYAIIYIDDMTINQDAAFFGLLSPFTKNKIIFTDNSVIKKTENSLLEFEWYKIAAIQIDVPKVLFCNDELIITQRIKEYKNPIAKDFIKIINKIKTIKGNDFPFETYLQNIKPIKHATQKVLDLEYPKHDSTFFHGDLSTTNVLVADKIFCIDPNYRNVFGSYLTDAGKAYFSLVAFNKDFKEAEKIVDAYGCNVRRFAVAEGLRVCKYQEKYISIVNNIADTI